MIRSIIKTNFHTFRKNRAITKFHRETEDRRRREFHHLFETRYTRR